MSSGTHFLSTADCVRVNRDNDYGFDLDYGCDSSDFGSVCGYDVGYDYAAAWA